MTLQFTNDFMSYLRPGVLTLEQNVLHVMDNCWKQVLFLDFFFFKQPIHVSKGSSWTNAVLCSPWEDVMCPHGSCQAGLLSFLHFQSQQQNLLKLLPNFLLYSEQNDGTFLVLLCGRKKSFKCLIAALYFITRTHSVGHHRHSCCTHTGKHRHTHTHKGPWPTWSACQ